MKLKQELALFGFDGLEIGQSRPTPLSTIRSNRYLIGCASIETIVESPLSGKDPIVVDTGHEIIPGATA